MCDDLFLEIWIFVGQRRVCRHSAQHVLGDCGHLGLYYALILWSDIVKVLGEHLWYFKLVRALVYVTSSLLRNYRVVDFVCHAICFDEVVNETLIDDHRRSRPADEGNAIGCRSHPDFGSQTLCIFTRLLT